MKSIFWATLAIATFASANPICQQISDQGIRHSFLLTGTRTILVGENSEVLWEAGKKSRDGEVLSSGNLLIAFKNEVKEFTRDKKVVFHYPLSSENKEIGTAVRLESGMTMITELGKKPRLLEVSAEGEIVVEVLLQPETENVHMQTRMARKLPNGNYLVPHLLAFSIKEYTPEGEVVRIIKTDLEELGGREAKNWPFTAITLEDGSVMANLTNGNKTVLFSADGKVLWVANNKDVGGRFADPCGGQVLDNGNFVICSYGAKAEGKSDIFELNRSKEVIWECKIPKFRGAHEIHVLTTNGKEVKGRR